jgi:hypothetical protein
VNEDSTVVRFPQPEVVDDPLTAVLRTGGYGGSWVTA